MLNRRQATLALASAGIVAAVSRSGSGRANPAASDPVIKTSLGSVRGLEQNGVLRFLGVPYGAPAVTVAQELVKAMSSPSLVDCAQLPSWDSCADQLAHVYMSSLGIAP